MREKLKFEKSIVKLFKEIVYLYSLCTNILLCFIPSTPTHIPKYAGNI